MDDPESSQSDLIYRIAYGMAARLAEASGATAAILAEVARRMDVHAESIREAVEDALAGRCPRW